MLEGVLIRNKDGIIRNVVVERQGPNIFTRNTEVYKSRCHYNTPNGHTLHACDLELYDTVDETQSGGVFMRAVPAPFNKFLFLGDIIFVQTETVDGPIVNMGINDMAMFTQGTHPELNAGFIIPMNSHIHSPTIIDDEDVEGDEDEDEDVEEEGVDDEGTLDTSETRDASTVTIEEDDEEDDEEEFYDDAEL